MDYNKIKTMEVNFLEQRADEFLKTAKEGILAKRYNLAAFHFEQAAQLYLKHCLFVTLKEFPKIHELDKLVKGIGKACEKSEEAENFLKENSSVIGDLSQSYLTARYLPVDFNLYQVQEMEKFIERLITFLKKICPKI